MKDERIVDIGHNVRFAHNSICTVHVNADTIAENARPGTTVFV